MPCKFNTVYIDGIPGGNAFDIFTNMSRLFSKKYDAWSSNVLLEKLEEQWWNTKNSQQWISRCFSKLLHAPKNNSIIFGSVLRILSRLEVVSENKRNTYERLLKQYLDPDNNSITLLISTDKRDVNSYYYSAVSKGLPIGLLLFNRYVEDMSLAADKYKDDFNIVKVGGSGKLAKVYRAITKESLLKTKTDITNHRDIRF